MKNRTALSTSAILRFFACVWLLVGAHWAGPALAAQEYFSIDTVAGDGSAGYAGDNGPARAGRLNLPAGIALDAAGNLYIADRYNHCIRKIDGAGVLSTVAGTPGQAGYAGDGGPGGKALLRLPTGLALDAGGNLYIADSGNQVVRKLDNRGVLSTVAGTGQEGYAGDGGQARQAQFKQPGAVAADAQGTLYVADTFNHRIRKIDARGVVTTVAGTGQGGYGGDGGPAAQAMLNAPWGLALDAAGNLYVADSGNHRVRRVTPQGRIDTLAGSGLPGYGGDSGQAARAELYRPQGVALDQAGNLYIADAYNHRVRRVTPQGKIDTVAGSGFSELANGGFDGDGGPATAARLYNPYALTAGTDGTLYIADTHNHRIRKLLPTAASGLVVSTYAGSGDTGQQGGAYGGDGGPAEQARFKVVGGVALNREGNVYVADTRNHRVRKIDRQGTVSGVAGTGTPGYGGDGGAALAAQLWKPTGLALDQAGNLYIADTGNHALRKIDARGLITSVAGTGQPGYGGALGAARAAQLNAPEGVAAGADGTLYVADSGNHCVRRIDPLGGIDTVAGLCGYAGYTGDGGAATAARLNSPGGVALDGLGNLYIADRNNHRVRRVAPDRLIETVAGNGRPGYSGDGWLAVAAPLYYPYGVALDQAGNLYFAEFYTDRVRKVDARGILTTLAGNGAPGYSGDGGPATAAQFYAPSALAVNAIGSAFYVADTYNHRVRKIAAPTHTLRVTVQGDGAVSGPAGAGRGIQCGTACDESYPAGSLVELAAQPQGRAEFQGWRGDCDAQGQVTLDGDKTCEALFSGQAVSVPTLPREDCGGTVAQPPSFDLATPYRGQALLEAINAMPDIRANAWRLTQDRASGLLHLELDGLRFSVQPAALRFEERPALTQVDEQQNIAFFTGKGVTVATQPAVADLCALRRSLAGLGWPAFTVQAGGDLSVPLAPGLRLSLRPDWVSFPAAAGAEPGLLFAPSPHYAQVALAAWTFRDAQGQTRRQYFYPAPAQPEALRGIAQNLRFGGFGQIAFDLEGRRYQGSLSYQVGNGAPRAENTLRANPVPDANGDGLADVLLVYPNGETQTLFAAPAR